MFAASGKQCRGWWPIIISKPVSARTHLHAVAGVSPTCVQEFQSAEVITHQCNSCTAQSNTRALTVGDGRTVDLHQRRRNGLGHNSPIFFREGEDGMSGKVLVSANQLADMVKIGAGGSHRYARPRCYAEAHIAEAVNMREVFTYLATSSPEGMKALRRLCQGLWKGRTSGRETAVIYEQSMSTGSGQSCRRRAIACLGYPKIKILHGGYSAWAAAGLPSTIAVPAPVERCSGSIEGTQILYRRS